MNQIEEDTKARGILEYERRLKKTRYFVEGLLRKGVDIRDDRLVSLDRQIEQFGGVPGEMIETMPPWFVY
jgi:hypothetical protein